MCTPAVRHGEGKRGERVFTPAVRHGECKRGERVFTPAVRHGECERRAGKREREREREREETGYLLHQYAMESVRESGCESIIKEVGLVNKDYLQGVKVVEVAFSQTPCSLRYTYSNFSHTAFLFSNCSTKPRQNVILFLGGIGALLLPIKCMCFEY